MKKKSGEKEPIKKIKIENKMGLTFSYDEDNFNEYFPHLITEIAGKKKSVKIDSIEKINNPKQFPFNDHSPKELLKPGAIDFIRRCSTREEALNILGYLLKRNEITKKNYNNLRLEILKESGLQKVINGHGGFKKPGHYENKFRVFRPLKGELKKASNHDIDFK